MQPGLGKKETKSVSVDVIEKGMRRFEFIVDWRGISREEPAAWVAAAADAVPPGCCPANFPRLATPWEGGCVTLYIIFSLLFPSS